MDYRKLFLLAILALVSNSTSAITFNITFDSTVTSQPNATQIETAYSNATQTLQTLYTNPITVNITVFWGSPSLGESSTSLLGGPTYSQIVNGLKSNSKTAYASNAVASLPVSDPVTGTHSWLVPSAEAKALGLLDANDPEQDGSVYFESGVSWTFNPTSRAVPGEFDFIAVALHETTEVLGRSSDLGANPSGYFIPFDLFHFTANGVRTFVPNLSGAYFSINDGATILKYFSTSSDPQDWLTGSVVDAYNASLLQGAEGTLSFADLVALNSLGYQMNFNAPRVGETRLANGNIQLVFTNVSGLNFQVQAKTNLASGSWTALGAPSESPAGRYIFTDTSSHPTRFYRVVLQ